MILSITNPKLVWTFLLPPGEFSLPFIQGKTVFTPVPPGPPMGRAPGVPGAEGQQDPWMLLMAPGIPQGR